MDGELEEDDWGYVEVVLMEDRLDLEDVSIEGSKVKEEFEEIKPKDDDGKDFCHRLYHHLTLMTIMKSTMITRNKHTIPLSINKINRF